jgi:hypothetical protein
MKPAGYIFLFALAIGGLYLYMRSQASAAPAVQAAAPAAPAAPAIKLPAAKTMALSSNPMVQSLQASMTTTTVATSLPLTAATPLVEVKATVPKSFTIKPAYTGPPISKYKKAVNGAKTPSLSDWYNAMQTGTAFAAFLKNIVPYEANTTAQGTSVYIVDETHRLVTNVYAFSDGISFYTAPFSPQPIVPFPQDVGTAQSTQLTDNPILWFFDYSHGNDKGPASIYGTIPAGSGIARSLQFSSF